jgi:ribosome-binding factor A
MRRPEQVRELVMRELGAILKKESDTSPSTLVTITEVVLSPDYDHATIKVSIWPDEARRAVFPMLSKRAGEFRKLLGKRLPNLHPLPHLTFELDTRVGEAARVEELLEMVKNEDASAR